MKQPKEMDRVRVVRPATNTKHWGEVVRSGSRSFVVRLDNSGGEMTFNRSTMKLWGWDSFIKSRPKDDVITIEPPYVDRCL